MKQLFKQIRPCPCGCKRSLQTCCGPLLAETQQAPTAVALMRSRYTASALGLKEYLLQTWHPSTRPAKLDIPPNLRWTGLMIHKVYAGGCDDHDGSVEFVAKFRDHGQPGELHETSRFVREQGQWLYLDGDIH